jgi:hypothetical protein
MLKLEGFIINPIMEAGPYPSYNHPQTYSYGNVILNKILWIFGPITILLPCYSYYMAVIVEKSVKPFPNSYITDTADQYPQNIAFRYLSGLGIASFVLLFFALKKWMDSQAENSGFHKMNAFYHYFMQLGVFSYYVTTETLDSKGEGSLHTPAAVLFFVSF